MAWTIAIWDDADWSAAAILNEFVGAVNERKLAAGLWAPFAAVVAGDDVQAATFFTAYQQWIEDRLGSFVVSHDNGVARVGGHYDGAATVDAYADLAAVFAATDLAHANWRRYTTHPDDAGVVAYGQMQAGDIIGPWIFEDIQKCLNVLVWTSPWLLEFTETVKYAGSGTAVTWAAATAAAEATYAPSVVVPQAAEALSWGTFAPPASYYAALYRAETKRQAPNVWNGVTRDADWYIVGIKQAGAFSIFDTYGDDVLEDLYSLFSQDEPATNATTIVSGSKIGNAIMMPNTPWCANPFAGSPSYRGWYATSPGYKAVVRWNVVGGLVYV